MEITTTTERDSLTIRYAIQNEDDHPLYLRNLLQDWYGVTGDQALDVRTNRDAGVTAGIAFVAHEGEDRAIFSAVTVRPPRGVALFAPRVALASRLEPGEVFRATIRAPLPLLEWHPYAPPRAAPTEPRSIRAVTLRVEYLRAPDATDVRAHPTFAGAFFTLGRPLRRFEASADLDAACPLLARTDISTACE